MELQTGSVCIMQGPIKLVTSWAIVVNDVKITLFGNIVYTLFDVLYFHAMSRGKWLTWRYKLFMIWQKSSNNISFILSMSTLT